MVIKRKFDMKLNFFKETKNVVSRFFSAFDVIASESKQSRNIISILKQRMYHPVSSANELTLKAKDDKKKVQQCGRSMIEMLGVLAIIGVLSVGGIAGYSEVMRKFKVNKTIEIFRDSLFRLSELETMNWNTVYELQETNKVVDLGLLPESICDENYVNIYGDKGAACQLPIGEISMYFVFGGKMKGEYFIDLTGNDRVKNCIDFLSYHWEQKTPKDWWLGDEFYQGGFIHVRGSKFGEDLYAAPGSYWAQEKNMPTELTMSNITQACSQCKNSEYCEIYMAFRDEY